MVARAYLPVDCGLDVIIQLASASDHSLFSSLLASAGPAQARPTPSRHLLTRPPKVQLHFPVVGGGNVEPSGARRLTELWQSIADNVPWRIHADAETNASTLSRYCPATRQVATLSVRAALTASISQLHTATEHRKNKQTTTHQIKFKQTNTFKQHTHQQTTLKQNYANFKFKSSAS